MARLLGRGGTTAWQDLNASNILVGDLRFGDFDGDGKTDVFATWGGKWHVSLGSSTTFGGSGPWQDLNTSDILVADLGFGDFDGDGKTDVFATWGGKWHVSLGSSTTFGGSGPWQDLNTSGYVLSSLGFGDFDGDGITDVWTVEQERHVALEIQRFTRVTLSNRMADAILVRATNVLQTDDSPGDLACLVHFARVGNVTEFTQGDGSVDSQAEFNALTTYSPISQVKAVTQITWCGGFAPNIIGCSPRPGSVELVTLQASSLLDGILWTHEYGHTRGIQGDYSSPTGFVMNGTISLSNRRVMTTECKNFVTK